VHWSADHYLIVASRALRRDDAGQPVAILEINTDVTTARQAERAQRESEERFRLLVDGVQDYAIFRLTPAGHVASWNAGAERLKGYRAEEIVGQHFSRFYPEDQVRRGKPERLLRVAANAGMVEDDGWRVRRDGSRFWADVVITALRDEAGVLGGFAKVTRDMTEREQSDERLQETAAELARSNGPRTVCVRGITRSPGAIAHGRQLYAASGATLPRPARSGRRRVHRVRG